MSEIQLEAQHLTKSFSLNQKQMRERHLTTARLVAVKDVSFALNEGEIYALLGPNGAGKTTTLRLLSSLLEAEQGTILFQGEDIKKNLEGYRSKVSFLTSELKLDDFFTPDYTFTYFGKLYGLSLDEIAKRKSLLFRRFGIEKFANVQIKNLSTGMKQKASLAIALCHDPAVIIFDEPTNGLDILASKEVEDFLLDLRKEGKTIIISTHIFSLVEKLSDRVGILLNGQLVKEGDLKELTKEQSLENVFFSLFEEAQQ